MATHALESRFFYRQICGGYRFQLYSYRRKFPQTHRAKAIVIRTAEPSQRLRAHLHLFTPTPATLTQKCPPAFPASLTRRAAGAARHIVRIRTVSAPRFATRSPGRQKTPRQRPLLIQQRLQCRPAHPAILARRDMLRLQTSRAKSKHATRHPEPPCFQKLNQTIHSNQRKRLSSQAKLTPQRDFA